MCCPRGNVSLGMGYTSRQGTGPALTQLLSAAVGACLRPSREVSCWQGNTLQQGQRRDALSLSPRGCEICLSKTVTVSRGPFSSLPLTALVTSGNSLSPFCFLISLV